MSTTDILKSTVFGGAAGGILQTINNTMNPKPETFEDTPSTTVVVVIVVIILVVQILLLMATYKLTGSGLQTTLCFFLGCFYLMFAFIYYGFSGYKFVKSSQQ